MRTNSLGQRVTLSSTATATATATVTSHDTICKFYFFLYIIGSISGFVSIGTSLYVISQNPLYDIAQSLTTVFLSVSYFMKLFYYRDKHLAFCINAAMGVGWTCVFIFSVVDKI
jgi:hypothetical protein